MHCPLDSVSLSDAARHQKSLGGRADSDDVMRRTALGLAAGTLRRRLLDATDYLEEAKLSSLLPVIPRSLVEATSGVTIRGGLLFLERKVMARTRQVVHAHFVKQLFDQI